jgi:hypothetical protein
VAWIEGKLLSTSGKISLSALRIAEIPAGVVGNNDPETLSIRVEASSSRNHFAGAKVGQSFEDGNVKDLHLPAVVSGDEDARVGADLAAAGDAVETTDGLEGLALADAVDMDARTGGDGEEIIVLGGGG